MKNIVFALLLSLLTGAVFAQSETVKTEVIATELAPGIYRLFVDNRVSVALQTGPDGLLLIDAAYDRTAAEVKEAIRELSDKEIRFLINTHLHGDHTGGNAVLGKGAHIIAHPTVKEYLSKDQVRGETTFPAPPVHARPDITIKGTMTLDFNNETIEITHLPGGHTGGDLLVYFPAAGVLVVGDLLFAGYFPYVDVSNGGNPLTYLKNVDWILNNFPDNTIFSGGHGPVFSKTEYKNWLNNLSETLEVLQKARSQGMDAEQMKSAGLLNKWASFGSFFITEDRWIDTLYPFLQQ
ncbi:MBL fold metallo-hydrolase [Lentimicrobium sp.]|uniref:MBL fold metallo-hydrolase n=1 Tax=Lentimicrobium sp. TaxID=2034841 RepID=UPI002C4377D9|nr:MBL fold metallo-hydrolase [Lentimicrobium sp.]HPF63494.1 MBL fold metallo-hydrolase [Lentimicrobium sp.]HRW67992.1 MBL fold metallo-hydrolase [Lentimicrobium sp.]